MSESSSEKVIKIDPEVVKAESEKIRALSDNKDLADKISKLKNILAKSKGDSVNELNKINTDLEEIVKNMNLLFIRTADFLDNKSNNFIELDNAGSSSEK